MHRATIVTLPSSVTQIQRFIDTTADRTRFTRWMPLINEGEFDTFFLAAIYTNFLTKSANPKSLTLRPHSAFIPCRFKSSSRISSYSIRSVGVQVSSGNPLAVVQSCDASVPSQAVHVHGSLISSRCVNVLGWHV